MNIDESTKGSSTYKKIGIAVIILVSVSIAVFVIFFRTYHIPTPAMEGTLKVGDVIVVNESYYSHYPVKRGDIVVFKIPSNSLNGGKDLPIALKTTYIKRCVALPGKVLFIDKKKVFAFTKDSLVQDAPEVQYSYLVTAKGPIAERVFEKMDIDNEDFGGHSRLTDGSEQYLMFLTNQKAEEFKQSPFVISVELQRRDDQEGVFPYSSYYDYYGKPEKKYTHWSTDNFGPLWIPKKGVSIEINDSTLAIYGTTIRLYDHNDDAKIENGKLFIDGKEVTQYTFKQNYYFMMGDNRHNSLDSRFWGFVPDDHLVGKALIVAYSRKNFNRFFKSID